MKLPSIRETTCYLLLNSLHHQGIEITFEETKRYLPEGWHDMPMAEVEFSVFLEYAVAEGKKEAEEYFKTKA